MRRKRIAILCTCPEHKYRVLTTTVSHTWRRSAASVHCYLGRSRCRMSCMGGTIGGHDREYSLLHPQSLCDSCVNADAWHDLSINRSAPNSPIGISVTLINGILLNWDQRILGDYQMSAAWPSPISCVTASMEQS